jgi:adenylate cyclase
VRVYRIRRGDEPRPAAAAEAPPALPERPSIVVLPFLNMSADAEQEYFSDGITEDLITDLSKIAGLFVIARNSSFVYKGRSVDTKQVSKDLGVRFILEGSVRKAGSRVRVTAQLIDGPGGGHLWAERYDRDLTDIFAVQDELTRQIVAGLAVKLSPRESERLVRRGTDDIEAYDCFLRGRDLEMRHTKESSAQGLSLLQRAVERDPGFAAAWSYMALIHVNHFISGWDDVAGEPLATAHRLARHAVTVDPAEPHAHFVLAIVLLWMRRHDEGIAQAQTAITLDPNFAPGHVALGHVLHHAGRSEEAVGQFDTAMRLDPHYPDLWLHFQAVARFMLGRFDEAATLLEHRIARNPQTDISRVLLAACYGHLGRIEDARAAWREALHVNPDYSFEQRRQILPYRDPADVERIAEGLRKAGVVD